ncbi:amino acid permease [Fodinisporobacter ferrooxydans]|uniref:Amino acid permease n=1 Tax=Fodinisporobacter ferrooxydans TaxID=2901836 RepID=A0ABY4CHR8_9BACL|nr:amino acid permease [Alicyclobacillaceae bacterium MYW30-H2]
MQKSKSRLLSFPNRMKGEQGETLKHVTGKKDSFNAFSLAFIGIGGIIGAGFFLASGMPIQQAGPGVLISYLFGALIMSQVLGSITSIAVNHPVRGSFRVYAEEMLGSYVGFLQGWVFFTSGVLAVTSEAVAMSIFAKLWMPQIPLSIMATSFVALIVVLNAFGVKNFGNIESVMSIVKVAALVGFILVGVLVIFGVIGGGAGISMSNLAQGKGGFLPNGWSGVLQAMLIVIFSYSGIGVIANAVSEVRDPQRMIPKATTGLIVSITVLYVASTALLLLMYPWRLINTKHSPFVVALQAMHLPLLATILNGIVLIAAFSVMAGSLYSIMSILRSLGEANKAPRFVLKETKNGHPVGALLSCALAMAAALILAYLLPAKVYNYLTSASAYFTFLNWTIMILTFLIWRKRGYKKGDYVSRWAFSQPYGQYITIAAIVALSVFSLWDKDQRIGFYYAFGIFILVSVGFYFSERRRIRTND